MASETTTINSSKRRKSRHHDIASCLGDLPIGILEHTASFLAAPSRALFSVALSTNNHPPSGNYSSIAGSDWDTLDFGEIEKDLAAKLSDDDISDVLQHIDAVNKLKRLRLTNLTIITGEGLEPLRGSEIIEQIDLDVMGVNRNVRSRYSKPPISCELVLPILDSIVRVEGCALKHLQFPFSWRKGRYTYSDFHEFIERYNDMRTARETRIKCSGCNKNVSTGGIELIDTRGMWDGGNFDEDNYEDFDDIDYYGLHMYTCYQCTKHYCDECHDDDNDGDNDGDEIQVFGYCRACERKYCRGCVKINKCRVCKELICEDCSKLYECNKCNKIMCLTCIMNEKCHVCSSCDVAYCDGCNKWNRVHAKRFVREVSACDTCNKACCNSCRRRMYQEAGGDSCAECIKDLPNDLFLELIKESRQEVQQLKAENGELKSANKELKDVNKELQDEIKELKDKQGN